MADGKVYRLITLGIWLGFIGLLLLIAITINGYLSQQDLIRGYIRFLTLDGEPLGSLMLYCYPAMLGIQYVFEGEVTYLPWRR